MNTIPIKLNVEYFLPYIPKRCRKTRYERVSEDIVFKVKSVTSKEAPIAFILSDYSHVENGNDEMRCFKNKLYKQYKVRGRFINGHNDDDNDMYPQTVEILRNIIHPSYTWECEKRDKKAIIKEYRDDVNKYLIIDGYVWVRCGEPRYCICTFGLGHNHGGTGLFVETNYNPNLPKDWYFSALDWQKAIDKANDIAQRRGDTEDVGTFKKMIEILMPEMVKVNPLKEHGEGDEFHRTIEAIIENSSNVAEAGLLTIMSCLR